MLAFFDSQISPERDRTQPEQFNAETATERLRTIRSRNRKRGRFQRQLVPETPQETPFEESRSEGQSDPAGSP